MALLVPPSHLHLKPSLGAVQLNPPVKPHRAPHPAGAPADRAEPPRVMGLLALVAVMYLVVSGGAYGLEDAVGLGGPRLALLLCVVVPFTLSLPTAMMAAELTALMPLEGGFYFWVKEAFGPFTGFLEAYLTILYSAVDMAIYPVLFSTYLSFMVPLGVGTQAAVGVALVWLAGLLNFLGVRPVGRTSTVLAGLALAPFVAMVALGLPRLLHFRIAAAPLFGPDPLSALGGGLSVVIWNFCGFENLSVVAAEIEHPRRNYLRAVAVALPLVALGYLLPLAVSLSGAGPTGSWRAGSFAQVGYQIGGGALSAAIALGGAVSAFAVFEAGILWVSRLPFVLAREGYGPAALERLVGPGATPGLSILVCCIVFTLLVPLGFVALVVLDVFFYMAALVLEMGALVRLRRLRPERAGLFAIGGGRPVLLLTALLPTLTWVATFGLAVSRSPSKLEFVAAAALALLSWPLYKLCRARYGGPSEAGPQA